MADVARLLTFVDLAADDDGPDASRMSVSARHEAVLADGSRVLLLDDRGWSEQLFVASDASSRRERRRLERAGVWASSTVEELERTARDVVGPDEPFEGRTRAEVEASHWEYLARVLRRAGIEVAAAELSRLPHDVELGGRVLARVGRAPGRGVG